MDCVSPIVLVKKKNGKLRVCVDYRKLNTCAQKDHFPIPFITLLLEDVGAGLGRLRVGDLASRSAFAKH